LDSELDFFVFFWEVEVRDEVWAEASFVEKAARKRMRNTIENRALNLFIISN
jgi:hypothetical protein